VNVGWLDGPTKAAVKEITKKYSGGYFDGMEDIYRHSRSLWTSVFGSAKYIFETRQHSVEALTKGVEKVCKDYGWPLIEVKARCNLLAISRIDKPECMVRRRFASEK
jgi:Large polyvalent protein associated domain 29